MPASELTALLLFASAMSFTPGPNTTLAAALAANGGLARAMRFVVAVPVGWGLLLLGCTVGLGALLDAWPVAKRGVQLAGLGYMLWLAWRLWGARQLGRADAAQLTVGFGQGVLLQFLNIKAWMAALVVSAGWITPAGDLLARVSVVLPLMMAFGFASNFSYALAGSALRGWLAVGQRLMVFNRVLALVLVGTAAWMATL
jgi:threonine/homoserine/homoserine lactone efflux protein